MFVPHHALFHFVFSGNKRPLSSDHTTDVDDFEPSYKAKRRLALPDVPKYDNTSSYNPTGFSYDRPFLFFEVLRNNFSFIFPADLNLRKDILPHIAN